MAQDLDALYPLAVDFFSTAFITALWQKQQKNIQAETLYNYML